LNGLWFSPEKENGKEKEEKKKVMVGMKVMDDDADVPIKVFGL